MTSSPIPIQCSVLLLYSLMYEYFDDVIIYMCDDVIPNVYTNVVFCFIVLSHIFNILMMSSYTCVMMSLLMYNTNAVFC